MISTAPDRPVLRYHGGKWQLAPWIRSNFPDHRIYVEPYGGAASLLLQKQRVYAEIYNDLDADIVNLFRVMRDQGPELKEAIYLTPFSRKEFELAYHYTEDDFEAARRTAIRAFMGFGSSAATRTTYGATSKGFRTKGNYNGEYGKPITGFRSCSSRSGTTPARDWKNYPDVLDKVIARLRGVTIECRDALEVMDQHDSPYTLHYCDPPYVKDTRYLGQSTSEYRHEMSNEDHEEFCRFVRELEGHVVISGYDNPLYSDLLGDWRKETRSAHADGAKPRVEVLWISPHTPPRQTRLTFE